MTFDAAESQFITYITGSSTAPETFEREKRIAEGRRTMVILDSDHTHAHVLEELRLYSTLVAPGCYIIVEDTNINGHPVLTECGPFGPGPMEALRDFLKTARNFESDRSREKLLLTFNPSGYLKRLT